MKLETFFERFDLFADAPDAVARMRELVLELAAHGKLVEQSRNDEPASALSRRIEKHIEELRSRKKFRGLPVEPLGQDALPEIPSTWEWVRLGNVVDYGSSDKTQSADIPEDAWLLDLEDIEKDTSRLLQRKSFRDSPSKSTKAAFIVGDVLYGKLRPYLNKVIVADAPGYCTTEIIPIRTFGFIDPTYLCYALKRPEFIAYANSKSYGMNLPRLGTEDARRSPFPLPPLAEQKRIVAKVDELMALCDRLEAQQQERTTRHAALARASLVRFADAPTPTNLHLLFHKSYDITPADLRKSILSLAVQGKLVPQYPNDEPVSNLVADLAILKSHLQAERKIRNQKVSDSPDSDDVPFEIPDEWRWIRLGQAVTLFGGYAYESRAYVPESSNQIIRLGNVKNDVLLLDQKPAFIPDTLANKTVEYAILEGDILVTMTGTKAKRD
jgi:type I restriction enzyme S subunit